MTRPRRATRTEIELTELVIGFMGLGRMGRPMAGRLLDAGHRLVVLDPSAAARDELTRRGATACTTPREVADAAELVLASLPTPDVVREVALAEQGAVHGRRMKLWIDLSTTGPRVAAEVAQGIAREGRAEVVDCPVSGGVAGAAKGSLTFMVAGSPSAREQSARGWIPG